MNNVQSLCPSLSRRNGTPNFLPIPDQVRIVGQVRLDETGSNVVAARAGPVRELKNRSQIPCSTSSDTSHDERANNFFSSHRKLELITRNKKEAVDHAKHHVADPTGRRPPRRCGTSSPHHSQLPCGISTAGRCPRHGRYVRSPAQYVPYRIALD
jgi:hypothetical protein